MSNKLILFGPEDFLNWRTINDTIMGGSSQAKCISNSNGLCLEGSLIEENGGFVSCRSPLISPPLDLSTFIGFEIDIEGQGLTLKIAISNGDGLTRFSDFVSGGIRWVAEFKTNEKGNTLVRIPFDALEPTIRAKPIRIPVKFTSRSVQQFQLLYSKFGTAGKLNTECRFGSFRILIRSINGYS